MKKAIALITAVTVIISILNISAYATAEPSAMTSQEYYTAQAYLIDQFCDGDITFVEWQERQAAVNTDFLESNKNVGDYAYAGAITAANQFSGVAQKIGRTVSEFGDTARERVAEWWNNVTQNVPTETTQTSTTDLDGYGALAVYSGGGRYYGSYVTIHNENYAYLQGPVKYLAPDGGIGNYAGANCQNGGGFSWKFYGDVRYADGTPAPSDDEFEYGTIKKFDDMTERELEDLFNDLAETIERNNPDLSSIEGLLNAIYARMGTLDSDNDNALLTSINANILALLEADNNKDDTAGDNTNTNEELVKTLLEIRDSLKNGTIGTSAEAHGHEISGTVYNVIPLDKEWLDNMLHDRTNLKVNYQGTVYYLETCGCLKLGDRYYTPNMNYEEYSAEYYNIDDLPSFTFDTSYDNFYGFSNGDIQAYSMARDGLPPVDDFLEAGNSVIQPYIDKAINEMAKAFTIGIPYDAISGSISTLQSIVFNNREPKDVVITINGKVVTILSADFGSYLTGGTSSGGGGNSFNYGDLLSGGNGNGNSHGGSEHGGGGEGGSRSIDVNSSDISAYSDDVSTSKPLAVYVGIVRTFSTILIGFSWALSMRKKIVAMI
ncbi:MAG: hypothetical protein NC253_01440 [Ruminococcus sp.]|nr:hypothetical protein [Ruminococcus sp.]MCM1480357.1 hypothetical protein [Muribaculaceae bacterium]